MQHINSKLTFTLILALVLVACSKQEDAQTPAPAQQVAGVATLPATTSSVEQSAGTDQGEKVFKATCSMCHRTGAGGAPIVGKKDEWAPRIAQGAPALYSHALKGFTGKKGMMPAKGGNPALSDDDVKAAVDYMVRKAS